MDERNYTLPEVKINMLNESIFKDIKKNFFYSISLNPLLENDIFEVYKRYLLNSGRLAINYYHLEYLRLFESLAKDYHMSDNLIELSNSLINIIDSYFRELDKAISIQSNKDLEKLKNILEISLILMQGSVQDSDIELAYEAFFQVERRIKKEKLFRDSFEVKRIIGPYEICADIKINLKKSNSQKNFSKELEIPFINNMMEV